MVVPDVKVGNVSLMDALAITPIFSHFEVQLEVEAVWMMTFLKNSDEILYDGALKA